MRIIKVIAVTSAIAIASTIGAFAEEFVKGKVKKVDPKKGKVSIIHEEIPSLGMPAMTMVFRPSSEEMLEKLEPGQEIEFVPERVNGKLTITKIKE